MTIGLIHASDTIDLRHRVLRSHQPRSACHYPGDTQGDSFHVGARVQGQLQCIASFFREHTPHCEDAQAFRLRGMATAPEFRGKGLGAAVLDWGCKHAQGQGARQVWCNARVTALGFYEGRGFAKVSQRFEIEGIGDHYVLSKTLHP